MIQSKTVTYIPEFIRSPDAHFTDDLMMRPVAIACYHRDDPDCEGDVLHINTHGDLLSWFHSLAKNEKLKRALALGKVKVYYSNLDTLEEQASEVIAKRKDLANKYIPTLQRRIPEKSIGQLDARGTSKYEIFINSLNLSGVSFAQGRIEDYANWHEVHEASKKPFGIAEYVENRVYKGAELPNHIKEELDG